MRNGIAAIVPLFLAIMLLFWVIWFLGGESDNLHKTTNLTHLHKVQDKLLEAAIYRRYELIENNRDLYEETSGVKRDALDKKLSDDNHEMMKMNNIDD